MSLKFIHRKASKQADACVIWLHGLGADGFDFADVLPSLGLPQHHTIDFLFPHAPMQAVTLNGGMLMPAWYDIKAINVNAPEDKKGLERGKSLLEALIQIQLEKGIQSNRIILVGFSQGGGLALYTGLRLTPLVGGIVALSSYLPMRQEIIESHINKSIPILMMHGSEDSLVPYHIGHKSYELLKENHFNIEWKTYAMGHTVVQSQLHDLGQWITKLLENNKNNHS